MREVKELISRFTCNANSLTQSLFFVRKNTHRLKLVPLPLDTLTDLSVGPETFNSVALAANSTPYRNSSVFIVYYGNIVLVSIYRLRSLRHLECIIDHNVRSDFG